MWEWIRSKGQDVGWLAQRTLETSFTMRGEKEEKSGMLYRELAAEGCQLISEKADKIISRQRRGGRKVDGDRVEG